MNISGFPSLFLSDKQARGIEPPSQAWEACILPMNYACKLMT